MIAASLLVPAWNNAATNEAFPALLLIASVLFSYTEGYHLAQRSS
jgi:hypothetical protein